MYILIRAGRAGRAGFAVQAVEWSGPGRLSRANSDPVRLVRQRWGLGPVAHRAGDDGGGLGGGVAQRGIFEMGVDRFFPTPVGPDVMPSAVTQERPSAPSQVPFQAENGRYPKGGGAEAIGVRALAEELAR